MIQLILALENKLLLLFTASAVLSTSLMAPQAQADDLKSQTQKGKKLFVQNHCAACHTVGSSGGCLAPPLTGINERRSKNFINCRISNDKASLKQFQKLYGQSELMPHPRLKPESAQLITNYLWALPKPKNDYIIQGHAQHKPQDKKPQKAAEAVISTEEASVIAGRKLYNEAGCTACHTIGGLGGSFAPNLDGIADRQNINVIVEKISRSNLLIAPQDEYGERGREMPPLNLSEKEIEQIASFLMTLKSSINK